MPRPATLDDAQAQTVGTVQTYLNRLTAFSASFRQSGWLGTSTGTFWVERPGRLRLSYDPPAHKDVVANDGLLVTEDLSDGAITTMPLAKTALGILLGNRVDLSGQAAVTGIVTTRTNITLTVQDRDHPDAGTLTFGLERAPLQLVSLTATDINGRSVAFTIKDLDPRPHIGSDLFELPASVSAN